MNIATKGRAKMIFKEIQVLNLTNQCKQKSIQIKDSSGFWNKVYHFFFKELNI